MDTAEFLSLIQEINFALTVFFWLCCAYRIFYLFVPFFKKRPAPSPEKVHSFAVLIAARNEEKVISNLLESISAQDYPSELISVFVVADNCTDKTADIAKNCGATVYERFDKENIGKGYALNFLLGQIARDFPKDKFDGFLVVDADNLLAENYVSEMNKTFSLGYGVVTSYRNSKNYGDSWVSSGYALWFLHEAKYLNLSRSLLGTSCAVSGTGFLFSKEVLTRAGGWNFFLLTEDIEFTIWNVLRGETIGYCHNAVCYDEQPVTFSQSWRQRMRWTKGYVQVLKKYGLKLFSGIFRKKGFACYDMAMAILPAAVAGISGVILNTAAVIAVFVTGEELTSVLLLLLRAFGGGYAAMLFIGAFPLVSEWKNIRTSARRKLFSLFTFPLFMMTYLPISIAALFAPVTWKPIEHKRAFGIRDMK